MLQNQLFRVQARFAKVLDDLILRWAHNWLRGEGGYFVEREGRRSRLPPAMRFVEVADFALEFMARLEELRENKDTYRKDAGLRTLCGRLLKCFFLRFLSHRGAETPTRAETADTVRYSN